MNNVSKALTFFTALVLGSTVFGIEKQIEQLRWPSTPRPKLEVRDFYSAFDGIHVPMVSIQHDNVKIEISKRPGFTVRSSTSAHFSAEIRDPNIDGVSLSLSLFDKKEFLPDLSEESWLGYKNGLKSTSPDASIVFENSNIDAPTTPYVFGKEFRQIAYTLSASEKRREIFAFVGNTLLVFTVQGSGDSVDQYWGAVDRLISEMSLL